MIYPANFTLSETLEAFRTNGIVFSNILDGGGGFGGTAKWFSRYTNGKVFCFEPFPGNWPFIEKEIKTTSNIELIKKALYDENVEMDFYVQSTIKPGSNLAGSSWNNMGGYSSLGYIVNNIPKQASREQLYRVLCVRADDEISASSPVQFIKLDLQGGELSALKGMERVMEDALFMYIEYTGQAGLLEYLEQKGMFIFEQDYFFFCDRGDLPPEFEFIRQNQLSTGKMATFAKHVCPYKVDAYREFIAYKKNFKLIQTDLICVPVQKLTLFATCLNNFAASRGHEPFVNRDILALAGPLFPGDFHVAWKLLEGCNHDCAYSHEPANILEEWFSESRLLETAHKILSLGREAWYFDIFGGEPSIHPYAVNLVKYLLTAGRKVKIRFRTNCLAPMVWYTDLLKFAPPKSILLYMDAHPKYIRIERIMELAGLAASFGQQVYVNVNIDTGFLQESNNLLKGLGAYQKAGLGGLSVTVFSGIGDEITKKIISLDEKDKFPENREFMINGDKPFQAAGFCVLGGSGAMVDPNCNLTLGVAQNDQPYSLTIVQNPALKPGVPGGPVFDSLEAAQNCLQRFKVLALDKFLSSGPVRSPHSTTQKNNDVKRLIRQRMRHVTVTSLQDVPCLADPDIWTTKDSEIKKIYSSLASQRDRHIFVHFLKTVLLGNKKYLPPAHADDSAKINTRAFTNLENEKKQLAIAKWRGDEFSISLNLMDPWLDCLALLAEAHNDREIFLETDGCNLLARTEAPFTEGYGQANSVESQNAHASFIFYNPDENLVRQFAKYFQDSDLKVDFLILITPQTPPSLTKKLRTLGIPAQATEDLAPAELWNFALSNSSGRYVCINPAADPDSYARALVMLDENPDTDILLCHDYPPVSPNTPGNLLLLGFLRDIGRIPGLYSHIYRRSLMEKAISAPDAGLPDDFQNLAALYFAKGVTLLENIRKTANEYPSSRAGVSFVLEALPLFSHAFGLEGELLKETALHYLESASPDGSEPDDFCAAAKILFGQSPELFQAICESLAATYDQKLCPTSAPTVSIQAVAPLAVPQSGPFPLSIVVAQNSAILNWREAAAMAEINSVEWIVVDNSRDEDTALELEDLTSMLPNVKLLRSTQPQSTADCYKAGLSAATGNAVMFVAGDSLPLPGLADRVQRLLHDFPAMDIFIFALAHDVVDLQNFALDNSSRTQILNLFTSGHISFELERMVYRRDFLADCDLHFDPESSCLEADFITRSIVEAKSMFCMDMASCSTAPKLGDEAGPVAGSLNSVGRLFGILDKLDAPQQTATQDIAEYFLRNVWLPAYAALRGAGHPVGTLPDSILFKNAVLRECLKEHSRTCA